MYYSETAIASTRGRPKSAGKSLGNQSNQPRSLSYGEVWAEAEMDETGVQRDLNDGFI